MVKLIPIPEMRGLVVLAGSNNIPFSLEILKLLLTIFRDLLYLLYLKWILSVT